MRTAVDRVGRGQERQVNARFLAMASHYVFEPAFCSPAAGWEKGQVEKNVQDAQHRLWQPMPDFLDLASRNAWLEQRCMELWHEIAHGVLPPSRSRKHALPGSGQRRRCLGRRTGSPDAVAACI